MPSAGSELESPITTLALGLDSRTTVNAALSPASLVTSPETGLTTMPAASRATTAFENSDVLPRSSDVAVAVIASPTATSPVIVVSIEAWPEASVRAEAAPTKRSPSPFPEGSAVPLAKNSSR